MEPASNQERAEDRYQSDRNDRGSHHCECLRKCQGVEQLPFHPGQREDRNEGQNNDGHCEKDRPSNKPRCAKSDFANPGAVFPMFLVIRFCMPQDVLCHDDSGIHEHSDGYRNAAKRHDVGGNPEVVHE